jgi:hypothetical protein
MKLASFMQYAVGIAPDLPRNQRFWVADNNMRYTDGGLRPLPGQYFLAASLSDSPVTGMLEVLDENVDPSAATLYFGTADGLYEVTGGVTTDVSRVAAYTGGAYDKWTLAQWGRWRLATNGIDEAQLFRKGTVTDFEDWSSVGGSELATEQRAEIVRVIGPHVVLLNTGNTTDDSGDATEYKWCHADDLLVWLPTEANSAGDLLIRELGSGIIAAEPFRDGLAVYGTNKMFYVRNSGYPYYFGHQFLLEGIGAVSKNAVTQVGGMHYGIGPHGFWLTDGASVSYIDKAIHTEVFDSIDKSRFEEAAVLHNAVINTVYFFVPDKTAASRVSGWSYDYISKAWGKLDFFRTAGSPGSIFNYALSGDSTGGLYIQSSPESGDIPTFENPVVLEDEIMLVLPATYGEHGYGDGFYGGVYTSPKETDFTARIVAIGNLSLVLVVDGVNYPIGVISETATAYAETDWLDLSSQKAQAANLFKFIDYVAVTLKNKDLAENFQLTISYTNSLDEDGTELPPILFSSLLGVDTTSKLLNGNIYEGLPDEAVFFKFRFEDTKIIDPSWHLTQFDVHGEYTGELT